MTKSTLDIHVPPLTQANGEDAKSGSRDRKLSICLRGYAFKECKEWTLFGCSGIVATKMSKSDKNCLMLVQIWGTRPKMDRIQSNTAHNRIEINNNQRRSNGHKAKTNTQINRKEQIKQICRDRICFSSSTAKRNINRHKQCKLEMKYKQNMPISGEIKRIKGRSRQGHDVGVKIDAW